LKQIAANHYQHIAKSRLVVATSTHLKANSLMDVKLSMLGHNTKNEKALFMKKPIDRMVNHLKYNVLTK
jgi:hypothetical protein